MVQPQSDANSNIEQSRDNNRNEDKDLFASLRNLEAENQQLRRHNHCLQQENAWLKDQLSHTQERLKTFESKPATVEEGEKLRKLKLLLRNNEEVNSDKKDPSASDAYPIMLQHTAPEGHEILENLYEQASSAFRKSRSESEDRKVTHLNLLALHSTELGDYDEASNLLKDSIDIQKDTCGQLHPVAVATLSNLAIVYSKRGHFEKAETTGLEIVAIKQQLHGADHLEVASHLSDLASFCQHQGKHEDERMYHHRALHIYESRLGSNNVYVIYTKLLLAKCLVRQEQFEEADYFYKEILMKAYERGYGFVDDSSEIIQQQQDDENAERNVANKVWFKKAAITFPTISETLLHMLAALIQLSIDKVKSTESN
uniref:Kinesin light chain n=1 Tax=Glossina austeni TaxID=7395 RepID=A0A1A9VTK1_GLOAU